MIGQCPAADLQKCWLREAPDQEEVGDVADVRLREHGSDVLLDLVQRRLEELLHQIHLDPQHSLLRPAQISAAESVYRLTNLNILCRLDII